MKQHSEMRGGFPVAAFDTLPEAERVLVRALRHWSDGPDGQERIALYVSPPHGATVMRDGVPHLLLKRSDANGDYEE